MWIDFWSPSTTIMILTLYCKSFRDPGCNFEQFVFETYAKMAVLINHEIIFLSITNLFGKFILNFNVNCQKWVLRCLESISCARPVLVRFLTHDAYLFSISKLNLWFRMTFCCYYRFDIYWKCWMSLLTNMHTVQSIKSYTGKNIVFLKFSHPLDLGPW